MIQPIWTSLVERSLVSGPKSALCNAWAFGLERSWNVLDK